MNVHSQPYMSEKWFQILSEQVAQKSRRQVAKELDYSTSAISLVMNGKYGGKTDQLRDRVLRQYKRVHCPFIDKLIPIPQCQGTAHSKAPTHNPMKMQQWRACQSCPNKDKLCQDATQD